MRFSAFLLLLLAGTVTFAADPQAGPVARSAATQAASALSGSRDATLRLPLRFQSPGEGYVSIKLCDDNGILVRTLACARPVKPGEQTIPWDGTDDLGRPVPAGNYTANGLFFSEPPSLRFLMKVGKDGNPPYRTADGRGDWGGNLGGPAGICCNGKSVVLAWGCVEDNQITGVQQMDGDGNIQLRYFTFYPWDQRSAAAIDDRNLYLGILKDNQQLQIAEYKLGEPRGRILTTLPSAMVKTATGRWKNRATNVVDGLAVTKDRVFASVGSNDELFVIERLSGRILNTVKASRPRGLAVSGDRLLVVSGEEVVRYMFDGKFDGTIVPKGRLTAPSAICVARDGTIFVGDSGRFSPDPEQEAGSKQIYIFHSDGMFLRAIGKPGGAPRSGRFESDRLGDISGMCLGTDQKTIFVNDVATGFARTSRWSLEGTLQRQWFCRKMETQADAMNPARLTETVKVGDAFDDYLTVQAWVMDYDSRTWQPGWRYTMPFANCWQDEVVIGYDHGGNPLKKEDGHPGTWPIFAYGAAGGLRTFNGRNYMMSGEGAIWTYAADQAPKLVAMTFTHRCEKRGDKIQTFYDQGPNSWFTWADRNGDAKIQLAEVSLADDPPLLRETRRMGGCMLDEQMNVLLLCMTDPDPTTGQATHLCKLPLREILPNGAPVYDWRDLRDVTPPLRQPSFAGGEGTKKIAYVLPSNLIDGGDSWYCIAQPEPEQPLRLPGIDGEGWWASRNWRKKICRYDKATGACRWAVGRRAPGVAEPGQMYNPISLAGYAGDAVFAADALAVVWVWDKDGLYLGRLYNGPEDKKQDSNSMYIEMQGANVITVGDKIYLLANDCGTSVHEVRLPKRVPLQTSAVTLTADRAARARPWDADGLAPTEKPTCVVRYLPDHHHDFPLKIDGEMDAREGWTGFPDGTKVEPMLVLLDGQRLAEVRALYDEKNLYLFYSVSAANGPVNRGSELPTCPFVSGAYIDACFAPDWSEPQRRDVREGDMRVILARVKGEGGKDVDFQRGYWQRKADGRGGQIVTSPAAYVHIDQIGEVAGLKMAWRVTGKDPATKRVNYEVEVALPLESIGIPEPGGKKIGFDCSVGVANEAGDRRERAGHWAGQSEAAVVDRPGSARLTPATWGTLLFDPPRGK